jgi:hypothetical protein
MEVESFASDAGVFLGTPRLRRLFGIVVGIAVLMAVRLVWHLAANAAQRQGTSRAE